MMKKIFNKLKQEAKQINNMLKMKLNENKNKLKIIFYF